MRNKIFPEMDFHLTSLRDFGGIGDSFGVFAKRFLDFFRWPDGVIAFVNHSIPIDNRFSRLDTEEEIMNVAVGFAGVVVVVGGDEGCPRGFGDAIERLVHENLVRELWVVLNLKEIIFFPKNLLVHLDDLCRFFFLACQDGL